MFKWQKHPTLRFLAVALCDLIALSSLLMLPAKNASAATFNINNTASVSYTDNFRSYYVPANDTAAIAVNNIPIFRSVLTLDNPFSPNNDSHFDTTFVSYNLYDHDNAQDTVSLYITDGSNILRRLIDLESQNTGVNTVAWNGRNDTGAILTDGIYNFSLFALNADGNTATAGGTITLDMTPPTGSVLINNGATYCNSYAITLNLNAIDNLTGVNTMVISNYADFSTAETHTYSPIQSWSLISDTSTTKIVYVKYLDRVWNTSITNTSSILFDNIHPHVLFTNPVNGETFVPNTTTISVVFDDIMNTSTLNTTSFTLRNHLGETTTGNISYAVSINTTSMAFTPAMPLRRGETYTATINTSARDKAQNALENNYIWSFVILPQDYTPPVGTISINSSALYANTTTVTLNLTAIETMTYVARMYVSNSDFNNALIYNFYADTITWSLTSGDGVKKVTIWYEDADSNLSLPYSDTITLDMILPQIIWTDPADSQTNVLVGTTVRITFNDLLDTSTINSATVFIRNSIGDTIQDTIAYTAYTNTSVITLTPITNLSTYETYTVTVTTGIKDKTKLNNMQSAKIWWFKTGDLMAPGTVEVLKTSYLAPTQLQLNWRQVTRNMDGTPYTDTDRYVILRSNVTGGPYTKIGEVSASDTAYIDTTVTASTLYYYIVRAQDVSGNSSPFWIEVTSIGDIVIRIPRDNSRGGNTELVLTTGQKAIAATTLAVEDNFTKVFISRDAATILYQNNNKFGDDLGIYLTKNTSLENEKTRNLGIIVAAFDATAYKVTNNEFVSGVEFKKSITITMRYEVVNGFIKHTTIPAGLANNNLSVSYWNGIQWVRLGGTVDMAKQTISVTTTHLSRFAITALDVSKFTVISAEPNPFTPNNAPFDKVTFSFVNPNNEAVTLRIYDITGTVVYSNDVGIAVNTEWKGTDMSGRIVEDGVYIYHIQIGDKNYTGTVILAK